MRLIHVQLTDGMHVALKTLAHKLSKEVERAREAARSLQARQADEAQRSGNIPHGWRVAGSKLFPPTLPNPADVTMTALVNLALADLLANPPKDLATQLQARAPKRGRPYKAHP